MTFIVRTAVLAVLFAPAATPVALAQQASASATPATPATAAGTGSAYRSAVDGYLGFTDQPVGSWRKANDDVGRIGGMRTEPSPTPAAPAKAPAGHSGHRMP